MYTTLEELKMDFQTRPARMEDAQAVANLFNLCSQEIIQKNEFEAGEISAEWGSPLLDMQKDTIMVWQDDKLVGYADVWGILPPYVRVNPWVRVHPDYKNRGIGWVLNHWTEKRAKESMQQAEENLQTFTVNYMNIKDQASIRLLSDLGAKPVRYSFVMEAELSADIRIPVLPANLTIRTLDPQEYKKVYDLTQDTFADHWGHIDSRGEAGLKQFENDYLKDPNYDSDLWFAAEDNGELVGMIFGNKATPFGADYGWVVLLGVRRDWRHHGIGKALLLQFFKKIKEKGSNKVGLSVDAESLTGATRLYEAVGMRVTEKYVLMEKVLREGIDLRVRDIAVSPRNQKG